MNRRGALASGLLVAGMGVLGLPWLGQASPRQAGGSRPWGKVRSWLYQLQKADPTAVAATGFDLVVTDYSRDGSDSARYSRQEVATMQCSPRGRKLVLSYLSMGEAEDYRWYWKPEWTSQPPPWLDRVNPDWSGNYKVRFWDPAWQEIVRAYLRRIVEAGFDGVYLDIIDAFEYYQEKGVEDAGSRMVAFVRRIAEWGRAMSGCPDFGVFPQNGEALLEHTSYLDVITGLGREDVYFGQEGEGRATPPEETREIERLLDVARARGRLVLVVDYTTDRKQMDQAYRRASARGYVHYCTVRKLDRLIIPAGHEPVPQLGPGVPSP